MKLRTLLVMGLVGISTAAFAAPKIPAGTYDIDPVHSKVGFEVGHLVISTVEGQFANFGGAIVVAEKPENTKVDVEIDTSSINTANADRDGHLKSPDFFDAQKHPKMTFKSNKVIFSDSKMKVPGELTIKGVTKPVTLEGKYLGTVKDMAGADRIAAQLSTQIKRKDFGLTWNKMIEAGPAVGDEVTINLKIEAVRKK